MKYFPKVSRGNIYLSPVNPDDYQIWTGFMNDSRITDGFNTTKVVSTIDKKKDLLEKISKDPTKKVFTIVNKGNDKMLGMIDLFDIDYIDGTAGLGVAIGDCNEHNKGYGTDAINAILLFGFYTLNLRNVDLYVFSFNEKAIKCYQKVGFQEYGRRKKIHYCNGRFRDKIYMDITKENREKKNENVL